MTSQPPFDPRLPKPGWYPDPNGQQVLRWWDGRAWGPHTQPLPDPQPGAYGAGPGPAAQQSPTGSRPRQRRGSHRVRNVFAVIGGLVVAGGIISAISSHGGVSTTASGSPATATGSPAAARKATAARVGSYFDVQDASGNTYRVTLAKVIDPAQGADQFTTPDSGKHFAGIVFRITALNGSPQDEDANNDAAIVGSNGQTYPADFDDIAGYTNFDSGTIHVAQGATETGSVTFQVPDQVKVTEVQWTAGGGFGSTVQWDVRS
jgi:hypothetical protein